MNQSYGTAYSRRKVCTRLRELADVTTVCPNHHRHLPDDIVVTLRGLPTALFAVLSPLTLFVTFQILNLKQAFRKLEICNSI